MAHVIGNANTNRKIKELNLNIYGIKRVYKTNHHTNTDGMLEGHKYVKENNFGSGVLILVVKK
jgi:hypothetical protein